MTRFPPGTYCVANREGVKNEYTLDNKKCFLPRDSMVVITVYNNLLINISSSAYDVHYLGNIGQVIGNTSYFPI